MKLSFGYDMILYELLLWCFCFLYFWSFAASVPIHFLSMDKSTQYI